MENPHEVDRTEIIKVLDDFGKLVTESRKGFIECITTSSSSDGVLLDTSLYILAPEISFEYRVINVEVMSVAEIKVRFFTLATNQSEHYDVDISQNLSQYKQTLLTIQSGFLFDAALQHLINQILLKREYKSSPIKTKIVPGQARVAILTNGQKINVGWIRIEGDYAVYYTGRGLREMWKPNMTADEQKRANDLKQRREPELIIEGMIAKTLLSDFLDIL